MKRTVGSRLGMRYSSLGCVIVGGEMKRFALVGVAGFVAPRHLKAIHDTGNDLVAALDPHDSVGILDQHFPHADFFVEFERFDRHIDKLRRQGNPVDYVSICSPNYLHDSHIRFALRSRAHAICEKPLVLNPWNVEALAELEKESGKRVWTILQLRLHPALKALRKRIQSEPKDTKHDVELTYIASRGNWYQYSWKGVPSKSGGVATNIGIHFFDLLQWIFGPPQVSKVDISTPHKCAGFLELQNARVKWFLSLDHSDLPESALQTNQPTHRSITVDHKEIEFSTGITDLHTDAYHQILAGNGFGLDDVRPSIEMVYGIRNQ
jgi:UDP-N-acetyl-2-amino-2-deoxyglucuronate dehydrogenase